MKIESFDDYITCNILLTSGNKFDIQAAYKEFYQKDLDRGLEEQRKLLKEQLTAELEPKIRNEIQYEVILDCISELRSEQRFLKSLTENLMHSSEAQNSMEIKNKVNIPIYDRLWYSIRKWQKTTDTTAAELARILGISERTLRDYDKSARTMTLEKLTNFINYTNGSIELKF